MAESKVSPAKRQALIVLQNGTGEKLTGAEKWAFFCGFDAGCADAIEECAKIAENEKVDAASTMREDDFAYNSACEHVAESIRRSLSRKQEEPR